MADLGLSFQPFRVPYEHYREWVTTCWLKRVWEKVDHYGFVLSIHNLLVTFPREGDEWLMARFIAVCVLAWAPAREDLFAILGTFEPRCMDPPHLAS